MVTGYAKNVLTFEKSLMVNYYYSLIIICFEMGTGSSSPDDIYFSNVDATLVPSVIDGPFSASLHYSKELDKMVYLFGEVHIPKECKFREGEKWREDHSKAIPFQEWLKIIVKQSKQRGEFVDFFIEENISESNKLGEAEESKKIGGLKQITREFKDCLKSDKSRCPIEGIRFHYTDVRDISSFTKNPDSLPLSIKILFELKDSLYNLLDFDIFSEKEFKRAIDRTKNLLLRYPGLIRDKLSSQEKLGSWFREALEFSKLDKQLKNIDSKEVKKVLNEEFDKCISSPFLNYERVFDLVRGLEDSGDLSKYSEESKRGKTKEYLEEVSNSLRRIWR